MSLTAEEERRLDVCSANTTCLFTEAACNPMPGLRSGITLSLLEYRHSHFFERYLGLEVHKRKLRVQQEKRVKFYSI